MGGWWEVTVGAEGLFGAGGCSWASRIGVHWGHTGVMFLGS